MGKKILIVDDEIEALDAMEFLLNNSGVAV